MFISPLPERLGEEERYWITCALNVIGEVFITYKIAESESEEYLALANNIQHQKKQHSVIKWFETDGTNDDSAWFSLGSVRLEADRTDRADGTDRANDSSQ